MSTIKLTIYKCDICGMETEDETEILGENVPCYGEGTSHCTARVDMCFNCRSRLRRTNFAEIRDWYGLASIKNSKEGRSKHEQADRKER